MGGTALRLHDLTYKIRKLDSGSLCKLFQLQNFLLLQVLLNELIN